MRWLITTRHLACAAAGLWSFIACGGGSGYNAVVVINRASANSLEAGNYYRESRGIPPENVLHISWTGTNISWSSNQFHTQLLVPLLQMLSERGISNQVRFVALSMDIPYKTTQPTTPNGTTSALFYGPKPDAYGTMNSYYASELPLELSRATNAPGYSFLTALLTADTVGEVKSLIDRSVQADGSFPSQPIVLAKSSDPIRNIRYKAFDSAILNVTLQGKARIYRTNSDSPWVAGGLAGLQTGLASFSAPAGGLAPGSMSDSLTSFGGQLFEASGQTSLLEFIRAGASGSYGTVVEPGADPSKFPSPQVFFYSARGFSLAEAYYQSLHTPHQGIVVGDPLCQPFAHSGSGRWMTTNEIMSGVVTMSLTFSDTGVPLSRVDLFLNGRFLRTVAGIESSGGNLLRISINGYPLSYVAPSNSTPAIVMAQEIAALINDPAVTNHTKVVAAARGDRLELRSLATSRKSTPRFFEGPLSSFYRVSYLPDPIPPLVNIRPGQWAGSGPEIEIRAPGRLPYTIEATENFQDWLPVYTNSSGTDYIYIDPEFPARSKRFYRAAAEYAPTPPPRVEMLEVASDGARIGVDARNASAGVLQATTDFAHWTNLASIEQGLAVEILDTGATNLPSRYYRAVPPPPSIPSIELLSIPEEQTGIVKVMNAERPYAIEVSSNLVDWSAIETNLLVEDVSLTALAEPGDSKDLTTFISAASPRFLTVPVRGTYQFFLYGSSRPGTWLNLSYSKTNGAAGSISITNKNGGMTLVQLLQSFATEINQSPQLSGPDGIEASDIQPAADAAYMNLTARSPGRAAAAISVQFSAGAGVGVAPSAKTTLDSNRADFQARNHLYIMEGQHGISAGFDLDTADLPDGFHELTAVAYEGTHVRTQTRATQHVVVTNTPLWAELMITGGATNVSVSSSFELSVSANTNTVKRIELFSTGGLLTGTNDVATATFAVAGTNLGVGLHPFYAMVETTNGWKFRTQTREVRFTK